MKCKIYKDQAYQNLAFAVIERAVYDYRTCLKKISKLTEDEEQDLKELNSKKRELEKFFRSDWCETLSQNKVDGNIIIKTIRKQVDDANRKEL